MARRCVETSQETTFAYALDTATGTPNWNNVFYNAPVTKQVAYKNEYSTGSSAPFPCIPADTTKSCETWSYSISSPGGYSFVTAPDSGTAQYVFVPFNYIGTVSLRAGRITKIVKPDGTIVERNW